MCIVLAKNLLRLSAHPDGPQLWVTPAPRRLMLLASEGTRTAVCTPHIYTQFKQTNKNPTPVPCRGNVPSNWCVGGRGIQEALKPNRLLPLSLVVSQNWKVSLSYGRHHKPQAQDLEEASWQPPRWVLALSIRLLVSEGAMQTAKGEKPSHLAEHPTNYTNDLLTTCWARDPQRCGSSLYWG